MFYNSIAQRYKKDIKTRTILEKKFQKWRLITNKRDLSAVDLSHFINFVIIFVN